MSFMHKFLPMGFLLLVYAVLIMLIVLFKSFEYLFQLIDSSEYIIMPYVGNIIIFLMIKIVGFLPFPIPFSSLFTVVYYQHSIEGCTEVYLA